MMSQLVPNHFYSVNPGPNRFQQFLQGVGDTVTGVASSIDDYAYRQAPGSFQKIALGADAATQSGLRRGLGKGLQAIPGVSKAGATRFAMSAPVKNVLRVVPGLTFLGAGLSVADVVAGQESLANRGMDAAAMGIGGFLGAAGGPVGIAAGMQAGKWASDATQWIFGDKKTPDQRKMEEALAALGGYA